MAKEKINIVLQGINKFDKTFKDVKRGLDTIDRKTKLIQRGLGLAAKTTAASFTAVGIAVGVSTARIDKLVKTSEKLGVGTEFLQKFRFAAEQVGIRSETADMALQRFSRRVAEARKGTGEAKDTLNALGIALFDSAGQARDIEDVMLDVSDAMANTEDASELVRQSFKFFDSEGVALVALMKNGSEAMQEFFTDAENLGAVLSTDAAKGVANFADEFTRVKTAIRGVMDQFTAGLAPILEQVSTDFAQFVIDLNGDIKELGFKSLGDYLAQEFLEILKTTIKVFGVFSNAVIHIINTISNFAASFGMIDPIISEENQKRIEELQRARDALEESIGQRPGRTPGEIKFFALIDKEIEKLQKFEPITPFDTEGTIAYLETIQQKLKDGLLGGEEGKKDTEQATENVSMFAKNASLALENFKKETLDSMMVKGFENAFKSAEDALLNFVETGKLNFKDMVRSMMLDLARIRIREFLTGGNDDTGFNLFGKVGDFLSSFDNGGFTGIGNRTGGIDGKGGFPAILHPNETVIDHHRGQQVGQQPVNVNFSIQATDATGIDELLASRKNQIVAMINQAMNQKGKVGLI